MKLIVGNNKHYIISRYDFDVVYKKLHKGQLFVVGEDCEKYRIKREYLGSGWVLVDMETGEVLYEFTKVEPVIMSI